MQNKWYSSDEAGYVALNGGWVCRRCGCANEGCDVCTRCGWNAAQGCGCQGGVVAAETTPTRRSSTGWSCVRCGCANENGAVCTRCGWRYERNCGCDACESRQQRCAACPAEGGMGHTVQCCPANTALRSATVSPCGCAAANVVSTANPCGCTMSNQVSTADTCGCAAANAVSTADACGCTSANVVSTANSCGCTAANVVSTASTCGCACEASAVRQSECPVAAGVGMVYAVKQELGDVYQSESALRTGTLFPELHKPMNGRCPGSCNASTQGQQRGFAAWDLRLYLDTHPDDAQARALFCQLAQEAEEPCYATTFLNGGPGWGWTDEPWPWECRDNNA